MTTAEIPWITTNEIAATLEVEAGYGNSVDTHEWRIACLKADLASIRNGAIRENESAAIQLNCEAIKFHMQALAA